MKSTVTEVDLYSAPAFSLSFPDGNEGGKEDKMSSDCPVTCACVFVRSDALKQVGCKGRTISTV
jgi:hypothetical protein